MDEGERWRDLDMLLTRSGNITGPGFEPGPECRECLHDQVPIHLKFPSYPRKRAGTTLSRAVQLQCDAHNGCVLSGRFI